MYNMGQAVEMMFIRTDRSTDEKADSNIAEWFSA